VGTMDAALAVPMSGTKKNNCVYVCLCVGVSVCVCVSMNSYVDILCAYLCVFLVVYKKLSFMDGIHGGH
jgi:hypothetical protein